jgi:hypothetical protein
VAADLERINALLFPIALSILGHMLYDNRRRPGHDPCNKHKDGFATPRRRSAILFITTTILFHTVGNTAGLTMPVVIGYILAATGSFAGALVRATAVN